MTSAYQLNPVSKWRSTRPPTDWKGAHWDGRPVVILTTIGAKTGSTRKNPSCGQATATVQNQTMGASTID